MTYLSPRTIQIYLPFGDPRGLRTAELTTRIVRVFEIPRQQLDQFSEMPASRQVGMYFLFGKDENEESLLYIGQTSGVGDRLKQHRDKQFWDRALVAVTLTDNLTQTHTQYLEWRSIGDAKATGRYTLLNGNAGSKPYTPAPLEADCIEIFETTATLLATLGYPVFEPLQPRCQAVPKELLFCRGSEADGRGYFTEDGLVVLKGSTGRRENVPSIQGTSDEKMRERLIANGILRVEGSRVVFEQDHLFSAPSTAAIALMGRTSNGWVDWKDAHGRTLKEIRGTQDSIRNMEKI